MNGVSEAVPRPLVVAWSSYAVPALLLALGSAIYAVVDPERGFAALLVGAIFGLFIALGAALLVAIARVTEARWWLPIAPVLGGIGRSLWLPALAVMLVVGVGMHALYPWSGHDVSHLVHSKHAWLNGSFFLARAGIVLLAFAAAAQALFRELPPGRPAAVLFILVFAAGISVGSWDWIMSREPEWFSTMFAVYCFSSAFLAGIAVTTLLALLGERRGRQVPDGVRHDLGKLLFGFSMFWAYIWFCQYMLIWYANIPEEATYFTARLSGPWAMLFWLNPVLGFVLPAVLLLAAGAKRSRFVLMHGALLVLVGRWLDTYLLIAPPSGAVSGMALGALGATAAVLLAMLALYAFNRRNAVLT